ncbi:N-acyl-D-amino-acid deacylase family protein [Steroidobacter sp.]|uniref:N-acyl-D-amino-acid deacylase family protein n=1 Tax=Steroidobacter sp. TaxID=1978227 RepID=UPI001A49BDD6|nr:D-aminoacylase [Steroidobacter sp.]MBL8271866.1 D-aminoacylase [Steroidobacter sp.]
MKALPGLWLSSLLLLTVAAARSHAEPAYDLLVRGGTIYDGSGGTPFVGDVGVRSDRIVYVGPRADGQAKQTILAHGKAVAPGFINGMSHATFSLLADGTAQSDLRQGVTLEIMGEGTTAGPLNAAQLAELRADPRRRAAFKWQSLGEYLVGLEAQGTSLNFASWVGATTVRRHVLGDDNVAPSTTQLEQMRELVRHAMEEGALGVASALGYAPAIFAGTDELVALATEAGRCGGAYASHMRNEGDGLLESLEELIQIARRSGAPATVFHLKASGRDNWPKLATALQTISAARAEGLRITANMYPYTASATGLDAAVPPWVQEGGATAFRQRLADPLIRARVIAEMKAPSTAWDNEMRAAGGPAAVLLRSGQTLADVAKTLGVGGEEAALRIIEQDEGRPGAFYFTMSEANLRQQILQPYVFLGSDLQAVTITPQSLKSGAHPRAYGTFARFLAKYVRDEKLLTLAEAVRRLTSLPAASYAIAERGRLRVGYFADLVIFDAETVQDHASFDNAHRYATGVSHVVVNGALALADGELTAARVGRFVRGRGWKDGATGGCRAAAGDWPALN